MAPVIPLNSLSSLIDANEVNDATRTSALGATKASLFARQAASTVTVTVTATADSNNGSGSTGLTAGAIAGIIIGSVVGILLLLWLIRSCFNLGASPQEREVLYHDVEPKRHRHHSRHHSRPRRYSHSSEVSMPAAAVVVDGNGRARSTQRQATYYYPDDRRGRRYKRTLV